MKFDKIGTCYFSDTSLFPYILCQTDDFRYWRVKENTFRYLEQEVVDKIQKQIYSIIFSLILNIQPSRKSRVGIFNKMELPVHMRIYRNVQSLKVLWKLINTSRWYPSNSFDNRLIDTEQILFSDIRNVKCVRKF